MCEQFHGVLLHGACTLQATPHRGWQRHEENGRKMRHTSTFFWSRFPHFFKGSGSESNGTRRPSLPWRLVWMLAHYVLLWLQYP